MIASGFRRPSLALTLFAITFAIVFSGCSTAKMLPPIDLTQESLPSTLLVLDYSFLTQHPALQSGECELVFRNLEKQTRYAIPIRRGQFRAVVQASPGKHLMEKLNCYVFGNWMLEAKPSNVIWVEPGKVNFADRLTLKIIPETGRLETHWQALESGDIKALLQSLHAHEQERVHLASPRFVTTPKTATM